MVCMRALVLAFLGAVSLTSGCGSDEAASPADATAADSAFDTATTTTDSAVADTTAGEETTPPLDASDAAVVDMGPDTRGEPAIVHAIASVMVDTLAGSDMSGSAEGTGAAAKFDNPVGIAFDTTGALVVTEFDGGRVRRVTTTGATSLVGSGILEPFGIAATSAAIYFQTAANKLGMKTDTSGTIWRIVGSAAPEEVVTGLGRPRGIASLSDGRLVVTDRTKNTVSLLDPATKTLTLIAGSGAAGFADGTGAAANFSVPYGAAVLPDGSVVVADQSNHCIRKVTLAGVVTLFAGDRNPGMKDDADKLAARFDGPTGVAADASGNVYVSDLGNHRIRRISAAGAVETVAGDGTQGFADGAGATAKFFGQEGIASATDGKTLYVTDGNGGEGGPYHRIRRVTLP
jgi:sugar lactone lactonase YvrE